MKAIKCNKCEWITAERELEDGSPFLPVVCERCGIFLGTFEDSFDATEGNGTLITVPYEPERGHTFVSGLYQQMANGLTMNIRPAILRARMSERQIAIVVSALAAFLLLGLFPPWVAVYGVEGRLTAPVGLHWLFSPPHYPYTQVDLRSLLVLWTLCAVIGVATCWLVSLIPQSEQKRLISEAELRDFRGWQHGRIFRLGSGEWWQQVSAQSEPRDFGHRVAPVTGRLYRAGIAYYLDAGVAPLQPTESFIELMTEPVEVRRIG
jgi:hypothetical protein